MDKLTKQETEHIAKLANLTLSAEELEKISGQLSETIDYIKKLNVLDTSIVLPTAQTTGLKNVFREDKVQPSLPQRNVLSNAKKTYKGFFVTKSVFD